MDDTSFEFDRKRFSSLFDFLNGAGGNAGYFEPLTGPDEDYVRAAIKAYTDAMLDRQAKKDADAEDVELTKAVSLLDRMLARNDITDNEVVDNVWQDAKDFLEEPFIRALVKNIRHCPDHWHCDPLAAAHECSTPDRTQPCPSCKAKPESLTAVLLTLKSLYSVISWPFKQSSVPAAREFSEPATKAVSDAREILRKWGMVK